MYKPLKLSIFMKAIIASVVVSFSFVGVTLASPNAITFQSRIVKPDGLPLEGTAVNFRFSITDTVGSCVIYQEDFSNRNMSGSKGLINLAIGTGSKVFPVAAMTLLEVFNNYNSPTLNCQAGGNIVAGVTDRRKLIVQFNDGSGWQTVPAMDINSNPYALQADSAHKLGDFPAADYVRTATFPTCVGGEALHFNGASFTCVAVGGGAGTVTGVSSTNADIGVSVASPNPVLTLNAGTGANQIVKLGASSELPAVSGANLTLLNASNLGSGTVPAARMPALTGDITMTAGTTATTIANNAVTNTHVAAAAAIARSKLATGSANHVLVNDGVTGAMSSMGCNNGEIIKWAAGVPTCSADAGGVGDILNAGNTNGAAVVIGTNDAQSLQFETNNAPAMTILSGGNAGGNVGVGTTSPSYPLDVYIPWTAANAMRINRITSAGAAVTTALTLEHNFSGGNGANGDGIGINFQAESTTTGPRDLASVQALWTDATDASRTSAMIFNTVNNATAASEKMRIAGNGNVGVGTASPLSLLHVSKNQAPLTSLRVENTNNGIGAGASIDLFNDAAVIGSITAGSSTFALPQFASRMWIVSSTSAGGLDLNAAAVGGDVRIYTGGALTTNERLRVTSTGSVGIGKTAPAQALDVVGRIQASMGLDVSFAGNNSSAPGLISASNLAGRVFAVESTSGHANMSMMDSGLTTRVRLNTSGDSYFNGGNVGVGVVSPNAKLDVNQTVAGSAAFLAESGGTNFFRILNPAGGITNSYNAANSVLYVGSDTGTGRSINASGTINAAGADFAEWVDWPSTVAAPQMGSVVLFKGSYVVVSSPSTAAFIGNDNHNFQNPILVAFAGQLPVRVTGKVQDGDLIVANGDGTARAIPRDQVSMAQARNSVGTAWASSNDPGLKRVNVAIGIGLGGHGGREIASLKGENKELRQENAEIKARLDQQQKELAEIKRKLGL